MSPGVVLSECRPERLGRLLAGPALEEPVAVPRVLIVGSPPHELDDPLCEVAIAHLLGEQQLSPPQLLCAPEEVVPEVVRHVVEPLLGRGRSRCWAGRLGSGEADAVVEDGEAAGEHGLSFRRRRTGDHGRQDREVDLESVLKEHAALLEAADGSRLEKGQQRLAERAQPGCVAQVPLRVVDEERQVDVGEGVGGRIDPCLRADEKDSANVFTGTSPSSYLVEKPPDTSIH